MFFYKSTERFMSVLPGQGITSNPEFTEVFKSLPLAFKAFKENGQRHTFIAHCYCKQGERQSVGVATLLHEVPLSIKYVWLLFLL